MKVCILATCRNPDLLPATLLVFDTIRIGFPTADIRVYGNALGPMAGFVRSRCADVGAWFRDYPDRTKHDKWVASMVWNHDEPIVICDTDMIFFEMVEHWEFLHPWAGFLQPEYLDPYLMAVQRERLHTSLLFVRPDEVRDRMIRYEHSMNHPPDYAGMDLFAQQWHPVKGGIPIFTDTGGSLYHAIGGDAFAEAQLDCYAHLHAGTWSDILGELDGAPWTEHVREMMKFPAQLRGIWREQADFYKRHHV